MKRSGFKKLSFDAALQKRLEKRKEKPRRYGLSQKPRKPLGFSGRQGLRRGKIKPKVDRKLIAWSKEVRERDDYTCQITGVRDVENNIAHHIAPRGRRPDLRYNLDNGMTLTPDAHQWVHDHPIAASIKGWLSDATYEAARKNDRFSVRFSGPELRCLSLKQEESRP